LNAATFSLRRVTPFVSLLLVAAGAAWVGVLVLAGQMGAMPGTMGLGFASFAGVWVLMMAAMMLPSVVPFASLYVDRMPAPRGRRLMGFVSGYALVWGAVAVPAFGLAWVADRVVDGHAGAATGLAVVIFAACGVYQLTPLKDRCLAKCRSPLGQVFQYASYRGRTRDLRVGVHHGAYCLGCCWALMGLLVAFGLMNVVAMVVLAGVVLVEKVWPYGPGFARAVGVVAAACAVLVIWVPGLAPGLEQSRVMAGM
jgi:predicted metal-binding membrane protein